MIVTASHPGDSTTPRHFAKVLPAPFQAKMRTPKGGQETRSSWRHEGAFLITKASWRASESTRRTSRTVSPSSHRCWCTGFCHPLSKVGSPMIP